MKRRALATFLACLLAVAVAAPAARADGDPGSDVLVYQPLFLEADSGVSVEQQARLSALLAEAQHAGVPIRVAIVASRFDLGAVTGLWLKPRAYARFLGLELSLAYTGRLVVVMPNGLGFNWQGHASTAAYHALSRIPNRSGGAGLADAAQAAVRSLAAAAGVRLVAPSEPSAGAVPTRVQHRSAPAAQRPSHSSVDVLVADVVAALAAVIALALLTRRVLAGRGSARLRALARLRAARPTLTIAGLATVTAGAVIAALALIGGPGASPSQALATNPNLDPGTPLTGSAPGFTLADQFGQPTSLQSFRGKVVLLAFNDSECTTICPLTTMAMLEAKQMLGGAANRVQLLGVDANPKATSLEDVFSYSQLHGMLHAWHFLTGSLPQLEHVWSAYRVQAAVLGGEIAHTPALFMIDPQGRLAKLYLTQQSYASIGQLAQLLAQEASRLLPGHPEVRSRLSYAPITGIGPASAATLPRAGGGSVRLGPGHARLYLFFATWDQEITSLAGQLDALDGYASEPASEKLPPLTAVDETSVEPSPAAVKRFLAAVPRPLEYPVALDQSGRVADGYEVQGQPWFVLASPTGRIVWYWQVSTSGWPSRRALIAHVLAALAQAPDAASSAAVIRRELAGAPAPLSDLHAQGSQLLGGVAGLLDRVRALHGYPVVINAWASWCDPCRQEFGLFASASAEYGRRVAFLGADTADSPSDARAFLAQHPVSYPSYQTSLSGLDPLVPQGLADLPTTIFLGPTGKLLDLHIGQYQAQGALDADIRTYALGG